MKNDSKNSDKPGERPESPRTSKPARTRGETPAVRTGLRAGPWVDSG